MRLLEETLERAEDLILQGEVLPLDLVAQLNELGVDVELFERNITNLRQLKAGTAFQYKG